ncbi:hypothetical protein FSP39_008724 [Pinctada imbricata]|uniref:Uncharacterized protein n=1 Tax=Pinctada imbricata TaxID=66713 RepID=A0AA88XKU6_PINIB|nr:hypothetical protein FSP39_008724 [Pinctada imbricata]
MATKGLDHWADIVVVVLYFLAIIGIGLWTLCRPNRGNVKSYFLAGRSMPWIAVGASLFSSNIGAEHFVGLAGAGASSGIALVLFEWFVVFLILICGWIILPVYISSGVYTLPEYMERRHGGPLIRIYLSCLALVLYVVTKLSASIFAGSLFIQLALGWDMYASIAVLLTVTGILTVLGGLTAVMYTDTFQTAVMVIGAFIVMGLGFREVGSLQSLEQKYMGAIPQIRSENSTCGMPNKDAFHLFLDPAASDYPWPGLVLQSTLGCVWYWCFDQVIVQRSLAAKNISNAKGGSLVAGYLKLLPLFLLIFPGMISRVLYPNEVACVDPVECKKYCDNPVGCSNIAYPKLVLELLPLGLRGLLMAVMLSAIMSSLTSIFNSSSTVFTMDLWRRARPNASQRELLIVGRVFIAVMCTLSILWIPLVKSSKGGRIFTYMTASEGYIASPIGILFLFSIFWKRTTQTGAFAGLLCGNIVGGIRLILEFVFPAPTCGEPETRPEILYKVNYLYFCQMLLFLCACVTVVVSLLTNPRSDDELHGMTWWTRHKAEKVDREEDVKGQNDNEEIMMKANSSSISKDEESQVRQSEDKHNALPQSSRTKRIITFLCGLQESGTDPEFTVIQRKTFLAEKPIQKKLLNLNAVLLIVVIAFLTGYFR